jgi:hypothetical protein
MTENGTQPKFSLPSPTTIIGNAIGLAYRILFEWWLDAPIARKKEAQFVAEIRAQLAFLFDDFGAIVVNEPGTSVRPAYRPSIVTLAIGRLLLRFVRGRGEFRVDAALSGRTSHWRDWKDIRYVLAVAHEDDENYELPPLFDLSGADRLLRLELPKLLEIARDEKEWDLTERKINAAHPPLIRIR